MFLSVISRYQQCAGHCVGYFKSGISNVLGTVLDTLRNRRHPGILKPDYAENSSKADDITCEIRGFVASADGFKVW